MDLNTQNQANLAFLYKDFYEKMVKWKESNSPIQQNLPLKQSLFEFKDINKNINQIYKAVNMMTENKNTFEMSLIDYEVNIENRTLLDKMKIVVNRCKIYESIILYLSDQNNGPGIKIQDQYSNTKGMINALDTKIFNKISSLMTNHKTNQTIKQKMDELRKVCNINIPGDNRNIPNDIQSIRVKIIAIKHSFEEDITRIKAVLNHIDIAITSAGKDINSDKIQDQWSTNINKIYDAQVKERLQKLKSYCEDIKIKARQIQNNLKLFFPTYASQPNDIRQILKLGIQMSKKLIGDGLQKYPSVNNINQNNAISKFDKKDSQIKNQIFIRIGILFQFQKDKQRKRSYSIEELIQLEKCLNRYVESNDKQIQKWMFQIEEFQDIKSTIQQIFVYFKSINMPLKGTSEKPQSQQILTSIKQIYDIYQKTKQTNTSQESEIKKFNQQKQNLSQKIRLLQNQRQKTIKIAQENQKFFIQINQKYKLQLNLANRFNINSAIVTNYRFDQVKTDIKNIVEQHKVCKRQKLNWELNQKQDLQKQLKSTKEELNILNQKLSSSQTDCNQLKLKIDAQQKRINQSQTIINTFKNERDQMQRYLSQLKHQNTYNEERIKNLQRQISEKGKQLSQAQSSFQHKISQLQKREAQMLEQKSLLKQEIQKYKSRIKDNEDNREQIQKQIIHAQKNKKMVENAQQQIDRLTMQNSKAQNEHRNTIKIMNQKNRSLQIDIQQLEEQDTENKNKITKLQKQIDQQQRFYSQMKANFQEQIHQLKQNDKKHILDHQALRLSQQHHNQVMNQQIQQLKRQNFQKDQQICRLNQQNRSLQELKRQVESMDQKQQLERQMKQLDNRNRILKEDNIKLMKRIQVYVQKQKQIQASNKQNQQLTSHQVVDLKQKNNMQQSLTIVKQRRHTISTSSYSPPSSIINSPLVTHEKQPKKEMLFQLNIINHQLKDKLFAQIHGLVNKSIDKAKLITRATSSTKKIVSNQFSKIPNILTLIRLKNNRIIGAFSTCPFVMSLKPEIIHGFLFSFANNQLQLYPISPEALKRKPKINEISTNNLIYGKSQIRVKIEDYDSIVNSNFGLAGSCFTNHKKYKPHEFLGVEKGKYEAEIKELEIVEITFEDKEEKRNQQKIQREEVQMQNEEQRFERESKFDQKAVQKCPSISLLEYKQIQQKNIALNQEKQIMNKKMLKLQNSLREAQSSIGNLKQQKIVLQKQINRVNELRFEQQRQYSSKQVQMLEDQEQKFLEINNLKKQLQTQAQQFKRKTYLLNNETAKRDSSYEFINKNNQEACKKIKNLQMQSAQLIKSNNQLTNKVRELEIANMNILSKVQEERRQFDIQTSSLKKQVVSLSQKKTQIFTPTKNIQRMSKQNFQTRQFQSIQLSEKLFNHLLFENDEAQKRILINHLQEHTKSRIIGTRLLYRHDKHNKSNFHLYIDGISNVVLVVKTAKVIIAGYYSGKIDDKQIMEKDGLLISVTNNERYVLNSQDKKNEKKKNRTMLYDKYYVIFGNAQIRIKSGEDKLFSNFGINNAYFNNKKQKVDSFLHAGEIRQVQIIDYEFYQIKLIPKDKTKSQLQTSPTIGLYKSNFL